MGWSAQPPHNPELNEAERRDCQVIWDLRRDVWRERAHEEGMMRSLQPKEDKEK
jgi:hypothetical protein